MITNTRKCYVSWIGTKIEAGLNLNFVQQRSQSGIVRRVGSSKLEGAQMVNGQGTTSLTNEIDKNNWMRGIKNANGQTQKESSVQFLSKESGLFSDVRARKERGYKEEKLWERGIILEWGKEAETFSYIYGHMAKWDGEGVWYIGIWFLGRRDGKFQGLLKLISHWASCDCWNSLCSFQHSK